MHSSKGASNLGCIYHIASKHRAGRDAAEASSVLVVCAVSRWQRRSSFDVNARGVLNALTAAIACGEPHDYCWGSGLHSSKSASNNRAGRGGEMLDKMRGRETYTCLLYTSPSPRDA